MVEKSGQFYFFRSLRIGICKILDPHKKTIEHVYGPPLHGSSHYQFKIPSQWNLFTAAKRNSLLHKWNPNDHLNWKKIDTLWWNLKHNRSLDIVLHVRKGIIKSQSLNIQKQAKILKGERKKEVVVGPIGKKH